MLRAAPQCRRQRADQLPSAAMLVIQDGGYPRLLSAGVVVSLTAPVGQAAECNLRKPCLKPAFNASSGRRIIPSAANRILR